MSSHPIVALFSAIALISAEAVIPARSADPGTVADPRQNATPIKHVVVIIGENRSFDHVFGTYIPKSGDPILNLLSGQIVQPNGLPGVNFAAARQFATSGQTSYFISVSQPNKTAYTTLPDPTLGGVPNHPSLIYPPFVGLAEAELAVIEPSLEFPDLYLLTTGATGAAVTSGAPDTRITNYFALPNGPLELTCPDLPYDSYTGDTTHRF